MILREIKTRTGVAFKPYSYSGFEKLVQNLRKKISGLPGYITLDVQLWKYAGWGARIRTWEWRNQNPTIFF
jgi:hypothetical protein